MFDSLRLRQLVTIVRFEFYENIRNRWLILYGLFFLVFCVLILYLGGSSPGQAAGSLLSLVLLIIPLFSLIFASVSFSNSLSFMEILLTHSVSRTELYLGKWLGLGAGLSLSFVLGLGVGSVLNMNLSGAGFGGYFLLLGLGVYLTFIFTGLAFLIVNYAARKETVFVLALAVWLFFFVLYDLLVLGVVVLFGDYPLEGPVLVLAVLNPIDLARIVLTLQMDLSALMGYTGALLRLYLGGAGGIAVAFFCLSLWVLVPLFLGLRRFLRRNL